MKHCISCREQKPLTEFYKQSGMKDGHCNKCKECVKAAAIINRELRIDYYRAYDRDRGNRQPPEYFKEYRKANRGKYKATNAVNNALRDGRIIRLPCEICGKEKVHGHHDDYSKPLDVRWLCAAHHRQWHIENGEAKQG